MGKNDLYCVCGVSDGGSDGITQNVTVHCYWHNNGWTYHMSPISAWVSCNGSEVQVMNGAYPDYTSSNQGQYDMGDHTFGIRKGHSAFSVGCGARFTSSSSYWSGSRSASSSFNIPAVAHHVVSYNANGGSPTPGNQDKWYGEVLYLSNTRPTRTGYNFVNWRSSNGTAWNPGQNYTPDENTTLTAQWSEITYKVHFDANGGSGAPGDQTKYYTKTLVLSGTKPTRALYNFKGWSTTKGGAVTHNAGGNFTTNANTTLYAVWELAYNKPTISGFTVNRCTTSSANNTETGTYIAVTFNWTTFNTCKGIKVRWKKEGGSWSGWTDAATATGKSGSVKQKILGGGAITADATWSIQACVYDTGPANNQTGIASDSSNVTYSGEFNISSQSFPIDVFKGGTGVAIGKVAEKANVFDVKWPIQTRGGIISGSLAAKSFLDLTYPVGSIYLSVNSTNPGTLFGRHLVRNRTVDVF